MHRSRWSRWSLGLSRDFVSLTLRTIELLFVDWTRISLVSPQIHIGLFFSHVTTGSLVRQCHWFDRERTLRWGKYPAEVEERRSATRLTWSGTSSEEMLQVLLNASPFKLPKSMPRTWMQTSYTQGVTPCAGSHICGISYGHRLSNLRLIPHGVASLPHATSSAATCTMRS
jgi:hypothetical protein